MSARDVLLRLSAKLLAAAGGAADCPFILPRGFCGRVTKGQIVRCCPLSRLPARNVLLRLRVQTLVNLLAADDLGTTRGSGGEPGAD